MALYASAVQGIFQIIAPEFSLRIPNSNTSPILRLVQPSRHASLTNTLESMDADTDMF